jgi:hypothetical protein
MQLFVNNFGLISKTIKTMRLLLILPFFLCLSVNVGAQKLDEGLLSVYSEKELLSLYEASPKEYNMLVYAVENGCYIAKTPTGKNEDFSSVITWLKPTPPTFLELVKEFGVKIENFNQYIKMEGTDNMVVVKSTFVIENELTTKNNR